MWVGLLPCKRQSTSKTVKLSAHMPPLFLLYFLWQILLLDYINPNPSHRRFYLCHRYNFILFIQIIIIVHTCVCVQMKVHSFWPLMSYKWISFQPNTHAFICIFIWIYAQIFLQHHSCHRNRIFWNVLALLDLHSKASFRKHSLTVNSLHADLSSYKWAHEDLPAPTRKGCSSLGTALLVAFCLVEPSALFKGVRFNSSIPREKGSQ